MFSLPLIPGKKGPILKVIVRRQVKTLTKRSDRRIDSKARAQTTEVAILKNDRIPTARRHTLEKTSDRYLIEVPPTKRLTTQSLHRTQLQWFKAHYGSVCGLQI